MKTILLLASLLLSGVISPAQTIYAPATLSLSCNAVTGAGPCTALALAGNSLAVGVTWQIVYDTGTASGISATLQGSNDFSLWTTVDTNTACLTTGGTGCSRSLTVGTYIYLRCNPGTYSKGSTNNLSCGLTVNPSGAASEVTGPSSSTDGDCALFDGTTGKTIKDGGPCGVGAGAGANTTLSNLGTVALNASLLPGVAAAENLGTAPLPFGDGYFGGAANHSFHFDTSAVASTVAMAIPNHASNPVQGIADPSDTQAVNYIGTDGVQHRIATGGTGTVTGTGTSTYLPYWSGTSSLGSTTDFTYTSGTHTLAGAAPAVFNLSSVSSFKPPGGGATLTLGTTNQNWATLGTGVVVNTTTTGAQSVIAASGAKCYPFQGSSGTGCDTPSGSGGDPIYVNVKSNGLLGDGKIYSDVTTVATNSTITSAAHNFVSADVGKLLSIPGAATPTTNNPFGYLNTTIATASGAHTCTLTTAPTVSIAGTAVATFATDDCTALHALIIATSAPATIFFPAGIYGISTTEGLKAGVNLLGAGKGRTTILKWMSTTDMTTAMFTGVTLTDVELTGMEWDGSAATAAPNGSNQKAIYLTSSDRINIHDIYAHEFPSTCIGTDDSYESNISDTLTSACGRMNDGAHGGGAGIGLGIYPATASSESMTVVGNTAIDNKRFGIFVEVQGGSTAAPAHFVIANNIVNAVDVPTGQGIVDAGAVGIVITGNQVYGSHTSSSVAGISVNPGTGSIPGEEGIIEGNYVDGFNVGISDDQTYLGASTPSGYSIIGNRISNAITYGIQLSGNGTYPADSLVVSGNTVHDSGSSGIKFTGTSGTSPHFTNVTLNNNILYRNGITIGTSWLASGIAIDSYITGLYVRGNIAYDGGSSTQRYGMSINSSRTVASVDIQMNNFAGNTVSATDFLSTPTGIKFNNAAPSGTGALVQTTSVTSSTNGDLATYDANGNTQDSGTLLSSINTLPPSGTGSHAQTTNMTASTTGDVATTDAAGNTVDSGVLLSSLSGVSAMTSYIQPGLGGGSITMASSSGVIYCLGLDLKQPLSVSKLGLRFTTGDATNYYGIAILNAAGSTVYAHNSPGIHVSAGTDFSFVEGTVTIPQGQIVVCTTGSAGTAVANGSSNTPVWYSATSPAGLSSTSGVITGTITTPPTASFNVGAVPMLWFH